MAILCKIIGHKMLSDEGSNVAGPWHCKRCDYRRDRTIWPTPPRPKFKEDVRVGSELRVIVSVVGNDDRMHLQTHTCTVVAISTQECATVYCPELDMNFMIMADQVVK